MAIKVSSLYLIGGNPFDSNANPGYRDLVSVNARMGEFLLSYGLNIVDGCFSNLPSKGIASENFQTFYRRNMLVELRLRVQRGDKNRSLLEAGVASVPGVEDFLLRNFSLFSESRISICTANLDWPDRELILPRDINKKRNLKVFYAILDRFRRSYCSLLESCETGSAVYMCPGASI